MHPTLARCKPEPIWSRDRRYRYLLWRRCIAAEQQGTVNFIMLNPSTSTREENDPTVHNCEVLARNWGFANLVVTNLFAYVTSDPDELETMGDPVGPSNNEHLIQAAREADLRVAAWGGGRHERYLDRAIWLRVRMYLEGLELKILRPNKDYTPRHPSPQALGKIDSLTLDELVPYDVSNDLKCVLDRRRPGTGFRPSSTGSSPPTMPVSG